MRILLSMFFLFFLSACMDSDVNNNQKSKDNISIVKKGIMKIDKSLRVGQAFDNWKHCDNKKWQEYKTDNGRQIIVFQCDLNEAMDLIKKTKKDLKIEKQILYSLDISSVKNIVQWTINVDNTFTLSSFFIEFIWNNGHKESLKLDTTQIKNIYADKPLHYFALRTSAISLLGQKYYALFSDKVDQIIEAEEEKEKLIIFQYVKNQIINGGNRLNYASPMPNRHEMYVERNGSYKRIKENLITDIEINILAKYITAGLKGTDESVALFQATCAACHMNKGEGLPHIAPSLQRLPVVE